MHIYSVQRLLREFAAIVIAESRGLDTTARRIVKSIMPKLKVAIEDAAAIGGRQVSVTDDSGGIVVKVNAYLSSAAKKNAWVPAAAFKKDGSIGVEVVIRPVQSAYSDIVEELVHAIRHELEHSKQHASGDTEGTAGLPAKEYLTHRKEVPAWVKSAMLRAKRARRPLSHVLQDVANEYGIEEEVIDKWTQFARDRWHDFR